MGNGAGTQAAATSERDAVNYAVSRNDFATARKLIDQMDARVASAVTSGRVAVGSQLRLTPKVAAAGSGGTPDARAPIVIAAVAANTSMWEATFELPASLPVGEYTAQISSGLASKAKGMWFPLEMYSNVGTANGQVIPHSALQSLASERPAAGWTARLPYACFCRNKRRCLQLRWGGAGRRHFAHGYYQRQAGVAYADVHSGLRVVRRHFTI